MIQAPQRQGKSSVHEVLSMDPHAMLKNLKKRPTMIHAKLSQEASWHSKVNTRRQTTRQPQSPKV
jgi:hypothetical protein